MNEYNEILNRYENNLIYRQEIKNKNNLIVLRIDILNKRLKNSQNGEIDFNEIEKYSTLIEDYNDELIYNNIKINTLDDLITKDKKLLKGIK